MKKILSSFELGCVVAELQFLARGIIDTISMPVLGDMYLGIHLAGKGKSYLHLIAGKVIYQVAEKRTAEKIFGFAALLRKHLDQARIQKIEQIPNERVIKIICSTKAGDLILFVEFYGRGNIVLMNDSIILGSMEKREKFSFAPRLSFAESLRGLSTTKAESVVKFLALDAGLGGVYAEELCLRSGVDKNIPPSQLSKSDITKLLHAWEELQTLSRKGYCVYKDHVLIDVTPVPLKYYHELETKEFSTYSEALACAWQQEEEHPLQREWTKKETKFLTIIIEQEKNIVAWEKERDEALLLAEFMYQHYALVKDILERAREAFHTNKPMPDEVKEVKRKERKVIVELE